MLAVALMLGLFELPIAKIPNMPVGWSWPPTTGMKKHGARCLERLDEIGVKWKKASPTLKVATPIVVPSMELGGLQLRSRWRPGPFVMDCHLALALATAAPKLRGVGVEALSFSGIHVYRHVVKNGKRTNILSRHAIGLAIDVPVIAFADGTEVHVAEAYATTPALREMEAALDRTGLFRTVLGPGNDPKGHGDHFHIEARMPTR